MTYVLLEPRKVARLWQQFTTLNQRLDNQRLYYARK